MKTKIYLLLAIFIFGIIATSFIKKANTEKSILIQSTDSNISATLLNQSAEIISNRLKDYSSQKFSIHQIPEKNQIQVVFKGKWNINETEKLLTQKGEFAFYETYNRKSLNELLNGDNQLFSLLNSKNTNDTVGPIGYASPSEVEKINNYINTLGLDKKCKFAWCKNDNAEFSLYALKIDSKKGALLSGTDIASMKSETSKYTFLKIQFKETAKQIWANATKANIHRTIAMVLDDYVISAPVVCQEIPGGNCEITGNFNPYEGKSIAAIGNNGILPLNFKIIK